jgi:hypothetical protein
LARGAEWSHEAIDVSVVAPRVANLLHEIAANGLRNVMAQRYG